jgi:hypothetical protein
MRKHKGKIATVKCNGNIKTKLTDKDEANKVE